MPEIREGIVMRTVDERIAAVRKRSARLRLRRNDRLLGAFVCLMLFPLAGLAGSLAMGSLPVPADPGAGLFGASSLFGSSVGGYVLVAVLTAAIAVAVTVFLMMRRKSTGKRADDGTEPSMDGNKEGREQWQR